MINIESIKKQKENILVFIEKMSYVQIHAIGLYIANLIGFDNITNGVVNKGTENEMVIYRRSDIIYAINKIINREDTDFNKYLDLHTINVAMLGINLYAKAYLSKDVISQYYLY